MTERLEDVVAPRPVVRRDDVFSGRIFDVVRDSVDLGGGGEAGEGDQAGTVTREYVDHPGAVAVVALDAEDRVALVDQYRHPVRSVLWEVPAGLLDVEGEPAHVGAARELAEEADLVAQRWDVLADFLTSPGGSNEALRVYLARELSPVPVGERHVRTDEEAAMQVRWVPLDDAVAAVLDGSLHNPSTVVGVLAAHASRAGGWASLRPVDAPWPYRRGTLPS
ncbi:ADP-ribose pyrophosphatase [Xylanimonas oleitrophica]|uniref:ADP-ribose pyrophosphatase n=1 Tax=Xylanimonas oleitrophica TaxID=2607479 RepID=A0A2W5WPC9_9MICO|nr:NUDIX hydrolase [Xylanimonas oleitrophica]PZR52543.1 ADP-ribose pyrophosphatase [Xylanimonas oleitrophica]